MPANPASEAPSTMLELISERSATCFTLRSRCAPFCRLQAALGRSRTVVGSIYLRGQRATGEGPT